MPTSTTERDLDRRRTRWALDAAAGVRFHDWTLDALTHTTDAEILTRIRDWLLDLRDLDVAPNLLLFGDVGVGKSTLAYAAARAAIEETYVGGGTIEWVAVRALLAAIRASFSGGTVVDTDLGGDTELVILDDLGAERVTDWTRDWLANVIEQRYDHGRATIVTTNYSPKQLAARLGAGDVLIGQRLASRLIDQAVVLELRGADRRRRAA